MDKAAEGVASKKGGATGVSPWGSTFELRADLTTILLIDWHDV